MGAVRILIEITGAGRGSKTPIFISGIAMRQSAVTGDVTWARVSHTIELTVLRIALTMV
jgi:hypothetical protein